MLKYAKPKRESWGQQSGLSESSCGTQAVLFVPCSVYWKNQKPALVKQKGRAKGGFASSQGVAGFWKRMRGQNYCCDVQAALTRKFKYREAKRFTEQISVWQLVGQRNEPFFSYLKMFLLSTAQQ